MNTDKIYAEQIANEYSEKTTSKVKQLKKLDSMAKIQQEFSLLLLELFAVLF